MTAPAKWYQSAQSIMDRARLQAAVEHAWITSAWPKYKNWALWDQRKLPLVHLYDNASVAKISDLEQLSSIPDLPWALATCEGRTHIYSGEAWAIIITAPAIDPEYRWNTLDKDF